MHACISEICMYDGCLGRVKDYGDKEAGDAHLSRKVEKIIYSSSLLVSLLVFNEGVGEEEGAVRGGRHVVRLWVGGEFLIFFGMKSPVKWKSRKVFEKCVLDFCKFSSVSFLSGLLHFSHCIQCKKWGGAITSKKYAPSSQALYYMKYL